MSTLMYVVRVNIEVVVFNLSTNCRSRRLSNSRSAGLRLGAFEKQEYSKYQ